MHTCYICNSFCHQPNCRLGAARIRDHKADDAFQPLILSIRRHPYIWSSWQELSSIVTTTKIVPPNMMMLIQARNRMAITTTRQYHDKVLSEYNE
jgi:hypothetical protein